MCVQLIILPIARLFNLLNMNNNRRTFIKNMGLGIAATSLAAQGLIGCTEAQGATGNSESLLATEREPNQPEPAPLGYDRLPLSWYHGTVQRLKNKVSAMGVDAILLQNDVNLVYFTGCFRGSGQRTTWALFPVSEKDTVHWFAPGIDRELINSWWATSFDYYFCYPHARGGFPNKGEVVAGERVELFDWLLERLQARGDMAGKTIATDFNLSDDQLLKAARALPGTSFVNIGNDCLQMRIRKTKEEIALCQRAYRYFDKVHAFARDFILEHGTDTTDFAIGQAIRAYGIQLMMNDIEYDGKPHTAVGVDSTSHYVRAGIATAYPHPNQLFYCKVEKGQPLYVNTDIRLGGFGGECYRNFLIAPWTDHQNRMWEVVTDTVNIMVSEAKPGVICSDVARKIHEHQVKNGMQEYIYHRPGHGTGQHIDGHQAPFFSLGDHTPLEPGMMFSVEPGLYDVEKGVGINPSDNLLITENGAVLMSRIPFTKEWCYLTL